MLQTCGRDLPSTTFRLVIIRSDERTTPERQKLGSGANSLSVMARSSCQWPFVLVLSLIV
jgi:hypothetical protein